jgi:UDP-MurNAc hydroxylase
VTELTHGQPFEVAPGFVVTSYQFGHFPDSILMIEADGTVIMNANDCKIMGLPLKQVLNRHPKIDFVLRSHSSANARLCFDLIDKGGTHLDDQSKYSEEFAEFVRAVNPRYAIPFASNNCYLHPETQEFNAFLNLGIKVKKYFEDHRIEHPQCVVCAPGDGWDDQTGFSIQDKDWYSDIESQIEQYRQAKKDVFAKTERLEKKAQIKEKHIDQYARQIFDGTPFFVRRLFKGKPITIVSHSDSGETGFELDIYNKRFRRVETPTDEANPIQIHAHARVLRMCIHQVNWSSLGISKRVRFRVRQQDVRTVNMFLELNDMFDCEVLPLSKSMNPRFVLAWLRRWRELVLYAEVVLDMMKGSGFVYARYLPGAPVGPPLRTS